MFKYLAPAVVIAVANLAYPAAASTDKPASCTVQNKPAAIVRAEPAFYPPLAALQHLSGTALIRVDLAASGTVTGVSVRKSSGSRVLDEAAMSSAKSIVYAPEVHSCSSVGGSYVVEVSYPQ